MMMMMMMMMNLREGEHLALDGAYLGESEPARDLMVLERELLVQLSLELLCGEQRVVRGGQRECKRERTLPYLELWSHPRPNLHPSSKPVPNQPGAAEMG